MKFTVRAGFVIHDVRIVEVNGKPTEQSSSYYEGDTVDFDEATATGHLHKLEPADRAATAYLSSRYAVVTPQPVAGGIDYGQLAQAIVAAQAAMAKAAQTPAPQAAAGT